jgi:hypothetical protein
MHVFGHQMFCLTAKLEYFEYMGMPLELFPLWIQEKCNLKMLAYKVCAVGNVKGSVGLTSGWHSCKQMPPA